MFVDVGLARTGLGVACTYRGKISAKGKGEIDMCFVDAAKSAIVG